MNQQMSLGLFNKAVSTAQTFIASNHRVTVNIELE
jgi:hypothetical protein